MKKILSLFHSNSDKESHGKDEFNDIKKKVVKFKGFVEKVRYKEIVNPKYEQLKNWGMIKTTIPKRFKYIFKRYEVARPENDTVPSLLVIGNLMIIGFFEGGVCFYDINEKRILKQQKPHRDNVSTYGVLSHVFLAVGSYDTDISIWNIRKLTLRGYLKGHEGCIISFKKIDEDRLASGGVDKCVKIWNWKERECIYHIDTPFWVSGLGIIGKRLYSCGHQRVGVWKIDDNFKNEKFIKFHSQIQSFLKKKSVSEANKYTNCYIGKIGPPNSMDIALGNYNNIAILNSKTEKLKLIHNGSCGRVCAMQYSNGFLITGSDDGITRVFDKDCKLVGTYDHDKDVYFVQLTSDGKLYMTGVGNYISVYHTNHIPQPCISKDIIFTSLKTKKFIDCIIKLSLSSKEES